MHQHARRRNIPLKKSLSIIKKMIVNGEDLNVTNFLPAILIYTEEFNMLHDKGVAQKYSPESIIGTLKR
ncbi:hypothetical protein C2G38_1250291 [Gigaspora rosea]|uniref:Uncharacterized protein n=1 Tax=Gigaspora rosea TaxID=44941 RepID=A0A397W6A6_9GLOM|nr:hypothetical protein C2G38_1250291 [Gigaspora rosea]